MLDTFLQLVAPQLKSRSGRVFYSGRSAFTQPSALYVLGLNPGGSPTTQAHETIERDVRLASTEREAWSAYQDESWGGAAAGKHRMQPRVLHLLRQLGRDPRTVPSSNVVFVRSSRESDLAAEKDTLLGACWPVHEAVIAQLGVRAVLCFGQTAGGWVREKLGAHRAVGAFTERNERRWRSTVHADAQGRLVFALTHPSIAAWTADATDPSAFVRDAMASL